MTAKFRQKETQTGFAGWIRNNPNLDSIKKSIVAVDSDLWIHKYKTIDNRDYQFLMLIEVKEFGKEPDTYQRDTLHIISQLLRNRRNTRSEWNAVDEGPRVCQVYSLQNKTLVNVTCFGAHLLRISGDGTYTHWNKVEWDKKVISVEQLEKLLRFELDPDSLSQLDHRPDTRHKTVTTIVSENAPLGFAYDRAITKRS